ncbi:MAG: SDR family oxidoreductase [Leptospirales bacterium]|jgi:short-subunit dehydrogenase
MTKKTALITGASTGIGYELAKCCAADGIDLILVARNQKRLEEVALELRTAHSIQADVIAADLSKASAAADIARKLGPDRAVDILINNAGFGTSGAFADLPLQGEVDMIEVNVSSLVRLSHLFLPGMLARKSGKIMNVASTAGFQPGPRMANYYASKAYVLSFSEALYEEVRKDGVSVTAFCPGATETPFFDRAKMDNVRLRKGGMNAVMAADEAARIGYRGMQRGKAIVIPGLMNRIMAFSVRITPRAVIRKITGYLNDQAG